MVNRENTSEMGMVRLVKKKKEVQISEWKEELGKWERERARCEGSLGWEFSGKINACMRLLV